MHYVITGGASGLGAAIVAALAEPVKHSFTIWDVTDEEKNNRVDVSDWGDVEDAAKRIDHVDVLVNCAGVNYIDWFEDMHPADFERIIQVNCNGIMHCTQALLPKLRGGGTVCNILSNAAHVPMTASCAYNASKAAATMLTRQMAHELGPRHGITCFGVSPNKLTATNMGAYTAQRVAQLRGWSPEQVAKNQRAALPAREETPVEIVADFIAYLLTKKERHKYLQGCILNYGGP
jgi:NAD(P)-dependent dehydrogenase (short-subunit alcohol dehydrogenase family)